MTKKKSSCENARPRDRSVALSSQAYSERALSLAPGLASQSTPPMISASSPRWGGGAEDGDK